MDKREIKLSYTDDKGVKHEMSGYMFFCEDSEKWMIETEKGIVEAKQLQKWN